MSKKPPHLPYFAILSQHRSGSHFLRTALCNRPRVWCHGEIFNHYGVKRDRWDGKMPLDRFLRKVYRRATAKRWGFVAHATHWEPPFQRCREVTQAYCERFVVLSRRDSLRQACSLIIAQKTNVWVVSRTRRNPRLPMISPTPEELVYVVGRLDWEHENNLETAGDKPMLHLVYEDMVAKPQATFDQVQKFLGLDTRKLKAETRKRETRPLQKVLRNYDELSTHPLTRGLFEEFA